MLKSICTVHFKSMYSSFLLILELKSINLAYCAIMQTSWIFLMIYLDLIHVIKISLQERDDCIFFRWNFTVRTTFCYIQWYNVFTNGALLIIRLLHFSQINHFGNLFYLPQLLVMHVLLYLHGNRLGRFLSLITVFQQNNFLLLKLH